MDAGQALASTLQHVEGSHHVFTQTGDLYVVQWPAPPEASDARPLRRLRETVRLQWVHTGFSQLLVEPVPWALGKAESNRSVERPWGLVGLEADRPDRLLPRDRRMVDIFESFGRQLLILGEPGAGKTVTLLELTQQLLDAAESDPAAPVPVVFLLSGWAAVRQEFRPWLVTELVDKYQLPRTLAERWLEEHRFILLLDGLDEMTPELQARCVEAINAFCRIHASAGLAVCSRVADYESLPLKLRIGAAVRIQPLADAEVEAYLARAGGSLAHLREAFRHHAAVKELLRVPLMLTLATAAYRDADPQRLRQDIAQAGPSAQRVILRDYVDRMLRVRDHRPYSREQVLRWMHRLARQVGLGLIRGDALDASWLPKPLDGLHALVSLALELAGRAVIVAWTVWWLGSIQRGATASIGAGTAVGSLAVALGELLVVSMVAGAAVQALLAWTPRLQRRERTLARMRLELHLFAVPIVPIVAIGYERLGDPTLLGLSVWAAAVASVTYGARAFFDPHRAALLDAFRRQGARLAIASVVISASIAAALAASPLGTTAMGGWIFHLVAAACWLLPMTLLFRSVAWSSLVLPAAIVCAAVAVDLGRYGADAVATMHFGPATLPATSVAQVVGIAVAASLASTCLAFGRAWLDAALLRCFIHGSGRGPARYDDFVGVATQMGFLKREGGGHVFLHRYLQEYFEGLGSDGSARTAP